MGEIKRGGARPGAGRKAKPRTPEVADKSAAGRIREGLNRPESPDDTEEIKRFRAIDKSGARESLDLRKWLYDKCDGKAVQTVNHLHDKPVEHLVTHTISERMRLALEKAEKRVSGSR